jgi:hypothetical protein
MDWDKDLTYIADGTYISPRPLMVAEATADF